MTLIKSNFQVKKVVFGVLILTAASTLTYFSFDIIKPDFFYGFKGRYRNDLENISFKYPEYELPATLNFAPRRRIWDQFPPPVSEQCILREYDLDYKQFPEESVEFLKAARGLKYKTILLYHASSPSLFFGFGQKPFEAACCKHRRCFMTSRRDVISIKSFDAVVINYRGFGAGELPLERSTNQRWVFYEAEPPTHVSEEIKPYNDIFNWTMTYRRDSDILLEYGHVYPKTMFKQKNFTDVERRSIPFERLLEKKTKMTAWLVSNCKTTSRRNLHVQELQKYVQVDIYGRCGSLFCDHKTGKNCYEMFEEKYKFYLSYENSLCKDYITEKFFRILKYYIIPVVFGSGEYDSVAPPHSYIDVRDFRSEKELAAYLIYLDRNNTAYLEYFKWKEDYIVIDDISWLTPAMNFCRLCEKLHKDTDRKTYKELGDWFFGKARCKT